MATTLVATGPGSLAIKGGTNKVIGTAPLSGAEEAVTINSEGGATERYQFISDIAWFWHDETGKATSAMCPVAAGQPWEFAPSDPQTVFYVITSGATGTLRLVKV